jgi:type IV pilus assembly protein PilN
MPSINLLPWRQDLRKRRQREFAIGAVAALALAMLVVLLGRFTVDSMISAQQRKNDLLKTEIAALDRQIEEIQTLEEQKRQMLARMEIIERLQRSRPEVVHLFDQIARCLPEGVYLNSVKQTGRKLEISGVAQSSTRVSSLMRNIDASDTLSAPELKIIQTRRDNAPGAEFTLLAQLRTRESDNAAGDGAPARSASRPTRGASR